MEEKIKQYIANKNWTMAVDSLYNLVTANPTNIRYSINFIYLLHDIIMEQDYPDEQHDYFAQLLKSEFDRSYQLFNADAVYLFFVSQLLNYAEWYFGLEDEGKPLADMLAFKLRLAAWQKEPNNILYEWSGRFSEGEEQRRFDLANQILSDEKIIAWIKSVVFVNDKVIEMLESTIYNYRR